MAGDHVLRTIVRCLFRQCCRDRAEGAAFASESGGDYLVGAGETGHDEVSYGGAKALEEEVARVAYAAADDHQLWVEGVYAAYHAYGDQERFALHKFEGFSVPSPGGLYYYF